MVIWKNCQALSSSGSQEASTKVGWMCECLVHGNLFHALAFKSQMLLSEAILYQTILIVLRRPILEWCSSKVVSSTMKESIK
jgi:hypothetical protein